MRAFAVVPRAVAPSPSPSTMAAHRCRSSAHASSSASSSAAAAAFRTRSMRRRVTSRALPVIDEDAAIAIDFSTGYTPIDGGVETWQLWFGFIVGLSPFVIAAYEFGKRIVIQRRCARCAGSGLITINVNGDVNAPKRLIKCTTCGGFLPWRDWKSFFSSAPGNGGVVRAPRGQTSAFYDVDATVSLSRREAAERDDGTVATTTSDDDAP